MAIATIAMLMLASTAGAQPAKPTTQPPSPSQPTTVEGWLDALDEMIEELDTSNCSVACAALESMRRAAEEVCKLDAGPPCEQARKKVETARQKVAEACPDCEAAKKNAVPTPVSPKPGAAPRHRPPVEPGGDAGAKPQTGVVRERPEHAAQPAAPPPSDEGGGCATCTVGRARDDGDFWWLVAGIAVAVARRRRR
jgi:MYXO-CTERM domain-containing protein